MSSTVKSSSSTGLFVVPVELFLLVVCVVLPEGLGCVTVFEELELPEPEVLLLPVEAEPDVPGTAVVVPSDVSPVEGSTSVFSKGVLF